MWIYLVQNPAPLAGPGGGEEWGCEAGSLVVLTTWMCAQAQGTTNAMGSGNSP
jgi:hypothetical protein